MSQVNRSPINTASGTGYRYWQDEDFTRFEARLLNEGVDLKTSSTALEVTEKSSGANMSVDVASGYCLVEITRNARTFKVWCENTATENLAISSNASGSTRYDIVCMKVDTTVDPDTQADNMCSLVIVEGTGGAGVPATPSNHLKLAEVEVANGASSISDSEITDTRVAIPNPYDNQKPAHKWCPVNINHSTFEANKSNVGVLSLFNLYPTGLLHYCDDNANDYCNIKYQIPTEVSGSQFLGKYEYDIEFFIALQLGGYNFEASREQDGYWGTADFTEAAVVPADATSTTAHIGFFLKDTELFASNADGSTQTKTSLGTVSSDEVVTLRFVFTEGTSIEFYKNEKLVATHTTNLPDSGDALNLFYGFTVISGSGERGAFIFSDWLRTKAGGGI